MNEGLIREFLGKLEQYGIKAWDVLVRGESVQGYIGVFVGALVIFVSLLISRICYKKAMKYDDGTPRDTFDSDWALGVLLPLVFVVLGAVLVIVHCQCIFIPEYCILKRFITK